MRLFGTTPAPPQTELNIMATSNAAFDPQTRITKLTSNTARHGSISRRPTLTFVQV
jgi:hypothetical protein